MWCPVPGAHDIFGGSGILEGLNDASEAWMMTAKDIIVDDACVVKVDSCP